MTKQETIACLWRLKDETLSSQAKKILVYILTGFSQSSDCKTSQDCIAWLRRCHLRSATLPFPLMEQMAVQNTISRAILRLQQEQSSS